MMKNDFAAFILTHGRANNVKTYRSLKRAGYTGKIFIIIDNEDDTENEYRKIYGDEVIQFDKLEISKRFDTGDTQQDRRSIVYARNASFEIAENLGIKYFIQLDDDYTNFFYMFNKDRKYDHVPVKNLDAVLDSMVEYLKNSPILTIAMAQGGDFIGGAENDMGDSFSIKRKAMNTFICSTDKKFKFVGRINEDVNTYTSMGSRGYLFFTVSNLAINQITTQKNKGGMTDIYLDSGTYLKSFFTVMYSPSSVKIASMGQVNKRLHHKIVWNNTVPCIVRESLKVGKV